MLDDAIRDERLAAVVEVESPRVRRAQGEDLEFLRDGVVAPDAAVEGDAPGVRRPRLADARVGQDAVAAVQPAVGAPHQLVEDVVLGLEVPAVQHHARRPGRLVAVRLEGNVNQVRRRAEPDAAEADRDAGQVRGVVGEDFARVEMAGPLAILEDEDAVVSVRAVGLPVGVIVRLGDPEAAAVVGGHGDRLGHVRLAGEERGVEAVRQGHLGGGLIGRRGCVRQGQGGVGGRGKKKADGKGVHGDSRGATGCGRRGRTRGIVVSDRRRRHRRCACTSGELRALGRGAGNTLPVAAFARMRADSHSPAFWRMRLRVSFLLLLALPQYLDWNIHRGLLQ